MILILPLNFIMNFHIDVYRLSPLNGTTKSFSANSCYQIKQQLYNATHCSGGANGLYWVKGIHECKPSLDVPIQVTILLLARVVTS